MICVTGAESTLVELRRRLERHAGAELQEVRIDHLAESLLPAADLGVDHGRLLLTCRPAEEGGGFGGSESERVGLLASAVETLRPAWVDVESTTSADGRERIRAAARQAGTRLLFSRHDFAPGSADRAAEALERLEALGGDAVKLAVTVEDAAELASLRLAARRASGRTVVLGMGPAGLLSRALYDRFHSEWTYVAADAGQLTAPGQLTAQTFKDWRLPPPPKAAIFSLLGGSQVMESPGPRVYNRLFAEQGIDACYLPVITDRPGETIEMLTDLGLRGASVTMPLKQRLNDLLDEAGPEVQSTGVVNTITVTDDGKLRGELTDGAGAVAALERFCGDLRDRQVVVLGTGGTAAAVTGALTVAGAQVTVLGRDPGRVEALASRMVVRAGAIEDLASTPFDVLVNTTPVGASDPDESLVKDPSLLAGKVVLDVVHAGATRLLRETEARGGVAVSGRVMWSEQGRRQLRKWLGIDFDAERLEED